MKQLQFNGENNVKLLESEKVIMQYDKMNNVGKESVEEGVEGIMVLTNIRVLWFSIATNNFNVSIPYINIEEIKMKDSK
jgi:Bardet-Biedl syndrome 5 protein